MGKRPRINTDESPVFLNTQLNDIEDFQKLSTDAKLVKLYEKMTIMSQNTPNDICERLDGCEAIISEQSKRIKYLEYKSIDLEARSRRTNLIFRNLCENNGENCFEMVRDFIYNELNVDADIYMERAHRLGRLRHNNKPRPTIVCFRDYGDVDLIMQHTYLLKGKPYSISRDYPQEIADAQRQLYSEYKEAKQIRSNRVELRYPAKLIISGRVVTDLFPDWFDIMQSKRSSANDIRPRERTPPDLNTDNNCSRTRSLVQRTPFKVNDAGKTGDKASSYAQVARTPKAPPVQRMVCA